MMLPLPSPAADAAPPTPAELSALNAFIHDYVDRFIAETKQVLAARCKRDGHRPVARWRGQALRCFRCQRCGRETQP